MNYLYSSVRGDEPARVSCGDVKYSWLAQNNSFLMGLNFAQSTYLTVPRAMKLLIFEMKPSYHFEVSGNTKRAFAINDGEWRKRCIKNKLKRLPFAKVSFSFI